MATDTTEKRIVLSGIDNFSQTFAQAQKGLGELKSTLDTVKGALGAVGVVLGGRLGYALFYGMDHLRADPLWALRIWEGGMSFHGGLIGATLGFLLALR